MIMDFQYRKCVVNYQPFSKSLELLTKKVILEISLLLKYLKIVAVVNLTRSNEVNQIKYLLFPEHVLRFNCND